MLITQSNSPINSLLNNRIERHASIIGSVTRIGSVFDAARTLSALNAKAAMDNYNTHAEDAASYKYTLYKQASVRVPAHNNKQSENAPACSSLASLPV